MHEPATALPRSAATWQAKQARASTPTARDQGSGGHPCRPCARVAGGAMAARPLPPPLRGPDRRGLGEAARSPRSARLAPRTADADKVVPSICPYCAVGCGQKVYVKDGQVTQIEGDPDSPISRGRLCPKGSASKQLVTGPQRVTTV